MALFAVAENVMHKLVSAIVLYDTKFAYTSAYFLAVIAQEEIAKFILLPVANEIGELEELISIKNRTKSPFYNHTAKQKLVSTYSFFNRNLDWKNFAEVKEGCLYVGFDDNENPKFVNVSPDKCYKEIKSALWFFQSQMRNIAFEKSFNKKLVKALLALTKILGGCLQEKMPQLNKEMQRDFKEVISKIKKSKSLSHKTFLDSLFKNPYELIRISKYACDGKHKVFLRDAFLCKNGKTYDEMIKHLEKYIPSSIPHSASGSKQ
jgi:AbiV family abortive infection protein